MFVVELTYKESLAKVEKYLDEHRRFLDIHYSNGCFIDSGPKVPRDGGVILVKEMSKKDLENILLSDPFYRESIADYKIIEFQTVKYASCLSSFFK